MMSIVDKPAKMPFVLIAAHGCMDASLNHILWLMKAFNGGR
jgi:hypothetical protein